MWLFMILQDKTDEEKEKEAEAAQKLKVNENINNWILIPSPLYRIIMTPSYH